MNWYLILIGLLLVSLSSGVFAITDTNLFGYWDLNEVSGDANDLKGIADGINTSIVFGQSGIINNDYNYNGSTGLTNLPNTIYRDGNFSWSFWIKPNVGGNPAYIIARGDASAVFTYYFHWDSGTGGTLRWGMRDSIGTVRTVTRTGVTANVWHHVVAVFTVNTSSNKTMKLYVDGNTLIPASTTTFYNTVTSDYNTFFGKDNRTGPAYPYKGGLDEVSFWKRGLSATDMNDLYNAGVGVTYCPSDGTFKTSCAAAPVDDCAPPIDTDWTINSPIECTNKKIDLGTGKLIFNTGGRLKLYDSNVTFKQLRMNGWGDFIYIFARSFLRIK